MIELLSHPNELYVVRSEGHLHVHIEPPLFSDWELRRDAYMFLYRHWEEISALLRKRLPKKDWVFKEATFYSAPRCGYVIVGSLTRPDFSVQAHSMWFSLPSHLIDALVDEYKFVGKVEKYYQRFKRLRSYPTRLLLEYLILRTCHSYNFDPWTVEHELGIKWEQARKSIEWLLSQGIIDEKLRVKEHVLMNPRAFFQEAEWADRHQLRSSFVSTHYNINEEEY